MYHTVIDILMTPMYCNSTENKEGRQPPDPHGSYAYAVRHSVYDLRVKFSTCLCSFPG